MFLLKKLTTPQAEEFLLNLLISQGLEQWIINLFKKLILLKTFLLLTGGKFMINAVMLCYRTQSEVKIATKGPGR